MAKIIIRDEKKTDIQTIFDLTQKAFLDHPQQRAHKMRNTSVSLDESFTDFIDAQVRAGRYGSAGDVVKAGLRLLEEHDLKLKALQEALVAGEESGVPAPFDSDAFLARMRAEHARK
jgi:antitoxin ParD1/3/4